MNVQTDAIHRFESECLLLEVLHDVETNGYCFHAEFKGEGVFERSPYVLEIHVLHGVQALIVLLMRRMNFSKTHLSLMNY